VNAAEVLATVEADGLELALRGGKLCVRPAGRIRPPLVELVRKHRRELRVLLGENEAASERERFEERAAIMEHDGAMTRAEAERAAGLARQDPVPVRWRGAGLDLGDLRPCLWCRNLTRSGRCLAAWRGELRASRDYSPTFPGQPQRCIGYSPPADDPDQRPGRERWPEMVSWQARLDDDGKPVERAHER